MSGRELLKGAARAAANLAAVPFLIAHAMKVPLVGKDRALESSTQLLSLLPGTCGQYLRRAFVAWTVGECHPTAVIGFGTFFSKTAARLGANVYIGPFCSLGSVTVERDAMIATGTHVLSGGRLHGTSDPNTPMRDQAGEVTHVTIGAGAWIGAGAIVLADVGRDAIVAAGAVVTRPVAARDVVAGIPAKVLRSREVSPA
jgi:virginiamycin A acetyltransferase